jgi:hypothetical protein
MIPKGTILPRDAFFVDIGNAIHVAILIQWREQQTDMSISVGAVGADCS